MSDMGKEGDILIGQDFTVPDPHSSDLTLGRGAEVHPPEIVARNPFPMESLRPSSGVEQAFLDRANDYSFQADVSAVGFRTRPGTLLESVSFVGDSARQNERVYIHRNDSKGEGVSFLWKDLPADLSADAYHRPRELAMRLIDGAAKLQAVRDGIEQVSNPAVRYLMGKRVDGAIQVLLKAATGVVDGRTNGSLNDALDWSQKMLFKGRSQRVVGLGAVTLLAFGAVGCSPQTPDLPVATDAPDLVPTLEPTPLVISTPAVLIGMEATPTQAILSTPTPEPSTGFVPDNHPTTFIDVSFSSGQVDMTPIKEQLSALGYDLDNQDNVEWLQVIENGLETVRNKVPGAKDADFVIEGASWGIVPRDANGNVLWAHDQQGNMLWAPVFFGSPDLTSLGPVDFEGGALQPEYKAIPDSKDAVVEMVDGFAMLVRHGFEPESSSLETYNSYVQIFDDGEWVYNEYALRAFANDTIGVEVSQTDQPYASEGVVVADDGSMWMYDADTGKMVNMETPEEWEIVALSANEDGALQVELGDGSKHWFDTEKGEWVEVEKVYTSCADPELMSEVMSNAVDVLGMPLEEYILKLIQEGKFSEQDPFSPNLKTYPDLVYVGSAVVSIAHLDGASNADTLFCAYFVDDSDPGVLIPSVVAYTRNGKFYQVADIQDFSTENPKRVEMQSNKNIKDWFEGLNNGAQIGDVFTAMYQTFSGVDNIDDVAKLSEKQQNYAENVANLMRILPNDYLARLRITNKLIDVARLVSAQEGDVGIIASTLQIKYREPLK